MCRRERLEKRRSPFLTVRKPKYPRGLTRDRKGWRITVGIGAGKVHRERRAPMLSFDDAKTALADVRKQWTAGRKGPTKGTLGADVTRYLRDYCTGRPHHDERKRHLDLWTDALGEDTPRHSITKDDVARVLHEWRLTLAADTCNKRRTALLALYHALDGRGASNPVREIPKFRAPDALPRGLDYALIERALKKLPSCKTRARLAVLAYTGIRAGQLMKLTPDDWDDQQHVLTVPGTAKGRGTKPYVVPLSERARLALKAFDRLDAWGAFTWAPMARMWKAAAAKAKLPAGTRPYDLRHSFGTAIYKATGDIQAARKLLGHSSLRVTERYTLAAVPAQQLAAVAAFDRILRLPKKAVGSSGGTFATRRHALRPVSRKRA
jgi:integrase